MKKIRFISGNNPHSLKVISVSVYFNSNANGNEFEVKRHNDNVSRFTDCPIEANIIADKLFNRAMKIKPTIKKVA